MATFPEPCGKTGVHGKHSWIKKHRQRVGLRYVTITDTPRCPGVKGFVRPGQRGGRKGRL